MFRQRIAFGNATGNLTITCNVAVAVGETIIVACTTGTSTAVTSVTDTAGNTYALSFTSASGTRRVAVVAAPVTTAITTSTTITINTSGAADTRAAAYEYAGLLTPVDKTAGAVTAGATSLATGATATLTQKSELIFTVLGGPSNTVVSPAGYNDRPAGTVGLSVDDLTVYDTTAVNLTWSWTGSSTAGVCVATFKRQPDQLFF